MLEGRLKKISLVCLVTGLAVAAGIPGAAIAATHDAHLSSSSAGCDSAPPNMIAWWPGEGTPADALGNYNGTIHGTVGYTAGEVGQAFSLTGSGYVQAPLSYLGPFTVDLWVSTANPGQARFISAISTGNPGDYSQFFEIDLDGSGNYQLEFGTNSVIPLGPAVSGFVHLAVTYDGSTVDAYYNGVLSGSINNVSSLGFETFKIGTNRDENGFFSGVVDEVHVFSRSLSQSEIQGIYNAGAAGVCSLGNTPPGPPGNVQVVPGNGSADVSWSAPVSGGSSPITSYLVTATPTYTDRIPPPPAFPVSVTVPSTQLSAGIGGLIEDCHQRYVISVEAGNASGGGQAATSASFQPSGIVIRGAAPPYVVILLDGYREAQPGFKMDPYAPTVQNPQSYCPESWNSSASTEGEADFWGTPTGPWSFFHKWNFGEVNSSGGATGNDESAPRAVPGNPQGITPGTYTHSFMLDAIAAQGAVILPFSYKGAMLQPGSPDPTFVFPPYTTCDSQPGSCGTSIPSDAALLAAEVKSIVIAWPNTPIVVVGHSQGGLIAFSWWRTYSIPRSFDQGFSLDSPINGINPCIPGVCVTLPSYPKYQDRQKNDPGWLAADTGPDTAFHFIGTYGDPLGIGPIKFYGTGAETLEHQMLFDYNTYSASQIESACAKPLDESGCPAPSPPDHISECPILFFPDWEQDAGHFVEKFCPGDVTFVDNVLGLPY